MKKSLRENMNSLITCLFEIVVGILLLIDPIMFTAGILVAFGVVILVAGIVNIVKYFRTDAEEAVKGQKLAIGLLTACIGAFLILNFDWVIISFPILSMIYGIVILFSGFSKIQWTVDMIRLNKQKWYLAAISALISIICALIIFMNPFVVVEYIWIFIGVALIVEAMFDLIVMLVGRRRPASEEKVESPAMDEVVAEETVAEETVVADVQPEEPVSEEPTEEVVVEKVESENTEIDAV